MESSLVSRGITAIQVPDKRATHKNSCFEPECRMNQIEALKILPQSPIDHLIAVLHPRKSGYGVFRRSTVKIDQDVIFRHQLIECGQDISVDSRESPNQFASNNRANKLQRYLQK